ncbi:C-type mannose receptor 2-like [Dreissena polymorpha]|uniref:C-type mannose receptor 2-like n=1 Tax=Dreissena polymorpha TaxID=45954 RepID=UPI002263ED11|nr:C-type mannose receptor 2-like [Dreissena polymorpha]
MGFIRTANVLILILCQHVANTCCWSCPLGWIERPDSVTCYRFWDARKMTWDSAQSTCQAYGGNLVQLNSKEEKKWIIEEVSKYPPSYEWWIGLRRNQENESLWQWIDGSFRNESNNNILWGSGEPNNFRDSEDCGEIWDNLLNDKDCRIPLQSICERPKESPLLCDVVHGWFDLTVAGADTACFKILDGVDSYADAEAACLKEESILARTESRDVLVALTAHLTSHAPASTFWLPYMLYTSGTPSWRFPGSDVDVTPQWWLAETPETQTLIDEKKLCAVVNASIDDNRNWSPVSCDSLNTAVCRKPIGDCPADYIRFLQWCVKVVDDQALTWWEARSFCNLRDTQLLRIKSSDMQYIVQKAEQFFSFNTSIWLGFAANGSDGWQWFDEIDSRNASFGDFENDKVESNIPSASHCGIVTANGTWSTADCGSTSVGTVCLGCAAGSRGDQCNGYREPGPGPTLNLLPKYVCPFGFTVNSADCYRKVPGGTVDWYTARGICAAEGAFLASPVSEEHRQYLRPIITEDTWTSLNDREMEGRYVWHDNTLMVGPGDWAANEPNNYEIGGTYSENCVLMRYTRDVTSRGRWRDVPCSFKAGVVCQKRAELLAQ